MHGVAADPSARSTSGSVTRGTWEIRGVPLATSLRGHFRHGRPVLLPEFMQIS